MSSYNYCTVISVVFGGIFRFVVDLKWFEKWKKYVGFESYDIRFTGKDEFFPGPIDNSALFKSMKNYNQIVLIVWNLLQINQHRILL